MKRWVIAAGIIIGTASAFLATPASRMFAPSGSSDPVAASPEPRRDIDSEQGKENKQKGKQKRKKQIAPSGWHTDYGAALALAKKSSQPLFVVFY